MTEAQLQLQNLFNTPKAPEATKVRSINIVQFCMSCFKPLEGLQKEIGHCEFCDKLI